MKDTTSDFNEKDYIAMNTEGEEITIIGILEKTQQVHTVTKEDIEKINPTDICDILEKKLNLSITKSGTTGNTAGVSIRGFGIERVAILIDGVMINSNQSGDFDLSKIDINNIEKIEVIYGGSDTKYNYSGAIGGVINIITKKNRSPGFYINAGLSTMFYYPDYYYSGYDFDNKRYSKWYDLFDTQNLFVNFGIGNDKVYWNLKSSGNRAFNNFIYKDYDSIKRRRINNQIFDTNNSTSLLLNLPVYMKLIFSGDFYYGNKNIPGPINSMTPGKEIDYFAKGSLLFDADSVGSERIDTEMIINNNFNSISWISGTNYIHNLNTLSVINRWGIILTDFLSINLGGDFTYDYLDSTNIGKKNSFNGGGYLTMEFSINKIALIIPSIKLVYYKLYPVPVPKLGFIFNIGKYFVLKNNYFRTFKLPTINQLYWPEDSFAEGNPDLKIEDGIGGDIILSFYKEKILSFESSFYVTYIHDAISWQPVSKGKWTPINVGEALYFGSDSIIKSGFSKYVNLFLSYSFLMTFVLDDDLTIESDKRMPYQPVHRLGIGAEFMWKTGNVNITGHFESERYTTTYNVTELKPYFTLDLNFSQNIKIITIFASIKNIFNSLYFLVADYPMPGGSVLIGLKIKYEKKFDQVKKQNDENDNILKNQ
ncbi:MAG: TonB-dependent receptor plug domain-containing protein [Spirochaetes bacterium]|nr:TonB-dependent receptor plug domain-containing protein [Spirochaetota bacterium]